MRLKAKELAGLLMSAAALVSSLAGLVKAFRAEDEVRAADKDRAYLWDDHGDQVAEVELLKQQMAELKKEKAAHRAPAGTGAPPPSD